MTVRGAHHDDLDVLIPEADHTSGPFSFDRGTSFELEAELDKEINRGIEIFDDDPLSCPSA